MKRIFHIFFCLFLLSVGYAQSTNDKFLQSQKAFNEKEYQVAIDFLKELMEEDPYNEYIHYNLANAYYQLGNVGESIYHYEKTLKINPDFEVAKVNLDFAKKMKVSDIKGNFEISQKQMFYQLFDVLSIRAWAILSIICSVLVLVSFSYYYFSNQIVSKKIGFSLAIAFFVIGLISVFITYHQKNYLTTYEMGIVIPKEVLMKEQPRESSKTKIKIIEGTKVLIQEQSQKWYKVKLVNDSIGWVKQNEIREL